MNMQKTSVQSTLNKVLAHLTRKGLLENEILECWKNIKKEYVSHAQPRSLRKGILYLDVEDSNWLYYCTLKKEEIKQGLKKFFMQGIVKDIKFRVRK